jgi:hypothetical protein
LIINVTYDSSVNSAPSGFTAAFAAAVQFLENTFSNPITINIDVGFGEINGQALANGALGESESFFNQYSYSPVKNALVAADTTSADQVSAANSLPAGDPTGGGNFWVATAEAKALGLMGASSAVDGYVGFSSSFPFTYNNSNGVAAGTYDFYGVALHELTEVMGRDLFVGNQDGQGIGPNSYTPLDLFHYKSNGTRDFLGTTAGYFSPDGGASNLGNFNTNPGGDFGDWASSVGNDAFLAFSHSGVVNPFSTNDAREMNVLGYDETVPIAAPGSIVFIGDFTGGPDADIVWVTASGTPIMWVMNGTTIASSATLPTPPPAAWHLAEVADFNGDGKSDLLWLNNSNNTPSMWLMNGTSLISGTDLPAPPNSWKIVATGDFNGDKNADILWLNSDNTPSIWEMNGPKFLAAVAEPAPPASWTIVGTGDFYGTGNSDILWLNVNNTASIWEMNGTSVVAATALPAPPSSWHFVGTADFNGDHKSDILWQNSNGDVSIWEMNGANFLAAVDVGSPGAAWNLIGAGDFNGDGKSDLLFLNPTTSQVQIWLMNGTQVLSVAAPTSAQAFAAQASATPLSSSPVLSEPDAYFAAASSYAATVSGMPSAGGPSYGPGLQIAALGTAPSGGLATNGAASDPLILGRTLVT